MRIAIFHNYLDNVGGAEIVCLQLARGLNADIYTTNINFDVIKRWVLKILSLELSLLEKYL